MKCAPGDSFHRSNPSVPPIHLYHLAMLVGVDASRITRPRRTGTENFALHVLRGLISRDAVAARFGVPPEATREPRYRLYLSEALPPGLLSLGPRVDQRLIRMPRLWTHVGLSQEMLRRPPDVLFIPNHVIPLVHPRKNAVVVFDVGHRFFPRAHRVSEWLYVEWAIRRHVRIADALVTISESSKQDLVRLYGADPARITVAYPGVDETFRPRPRDEIVRVRARYGLPERYVLHVGTLKPRKNLPRLVRAFAEARLPDDVMLVQVGSLAFGRAAMERAIEETGVRGRIRVLDFVDASDLPGLYSGASGCAIVSLYEGFGMPALEALACGAPTLVSHHGSLPEVVGSQGILVDPLDIQAIAHGLRGLLLMDDATRERALVEGPARARSFTWLAASTAVRGALVRLARA